MTNNIFGVPRTMRTVAFDPEVKNYDGDGGVITTDPNVANVVCSDDKFEPDMHWPCIDIDVPIHVVPSSTPGHSHLYINVQMDWPMYTRLLEALCDAGIVEKGYVLASERRGRTDVRLPWVHKTDNNVQNTEVPA